MFSDDFPDPGAWRGIEGLAAAMRQWLSSWEGFTIEAEEFIANGDVVVALVMLRARARASGAAMERRAANVHFFRGDLMSRLEIYPSREAGLRAAGLDPNSA